MQSDTCHAGAGSCLPIPTAHYVCSQPMLISLAFRLCKFSHQSNGFSVLACIIQTDELCELLQIILTIQMSNNMAEIHILEYAYLYAVESHQAQENVKQSVEEKKRGRNIN